MTAEVSSTGYKYYTYEEFSDLFAKDPWSTHDVQVIYHNEILTATFFPANYLKRLYHLYFKDCRRDVSISEGVHTLKAWFERFTFVHAA